MNSLLMVYKVVCVCIIFDKLGPPIPAGTPTAGQGEVPGGATARGGPGRRGDWPGSPEAHSKGEASREGREAPPELLVPRPVTDDSGSEWSPSSKEGPCSWGWRSVAISDRGLERARATSRVLSDCQRNE